MLPLAIGAGALIGGLAGSKSAPDRQISDLERYAGEQSLNSLRAYSNLTGYGANSKDVAAGAQAQRDFGDLLKNYQSAGMYDFGAGRQLAEQQYAPQRQLMQQAFQDQLAEANKQAALMGRNTNDPILRARLAQDQARQSMALNAQQAAASMGFAREAVTDRLGLAGQRAESLFNFGNTALTNQSQLFGMSNTALQSERANSYQQQQLDAHKGGGWMGALTGALQGASAGMGIAQGLSAMQANDAYTSAMSGAGGASGGSGGPFGGPGLTMPTLGSSFGQSNAYGFGIGQPSMMASAPAARTYSNAAPTGFNMSTRPMRSYGMTSASPF
jgi:hypothetical protein